MNDIIVILKAKFPRNDAWKQQLSEDQRERERVSLKNLVCICTVFIVKHP